MEKERERERESDRERDQLQILFFCIFVTLIKKCLISFFLSIKIELKKKFHHYYNVDSILECLDSKKTERKL